MEEIADFHDYSQPELLRSRFKIMNTNLTSDQIQYPRNASLYRDKLSTSLNEGFRSLEK